jgi:hypothetical protein
MRDVSWLGWLLAESGSWMRRDEVVLPMARRVRRTPPVVATAKRKCKNQKKDEGMSAQSHIPAG